MTHLIVHAMDTFSARIHNQNSHKHMLTYIPPIHTHTVSPSSSTISTVATSSTIITLGSDVRGHISEGENWGEGGGGGGGGLRGKKLTEKNG